MGLCLINHVDPLCFTSKGAVLGLINGGQSPFEKEIGYRLGSSEYTSPVGFDDSHVVLNKPCYNKWWRRQVPYGCCVSLVGCEGDLSLSHLYSLKSKQSVGSHKVKRSTLTLKCRCCSYDLLWSRNRFLVSPRGMVGCQRLEKMGDYFQQSPRK